MMHLKGKKKFKIFKKSKSGSRVFLYFPILIFLDFAIRELRFQRAASRESTSNWSSAPASPVFEFFFRINIGFFPACSAINSSSSCSLPCEPTSDARLELRPEFEFFFPHSNICFFHAPPLS